MQEREYVILGNQELEKESKVYMQVDYSAYSLRNKPELYRSLEIYNTTL